jgi:branched-chain amino acid aminotransferase
MDRRTVAGYVWVNGRLIGMGSPALSVMDRGFLYGDGIYETLRSYDGAIFKAREHWARLRASARGLGIAIPYSDERLSRAARELLRADGLADAVLRLTVSRGPARSLGFDPALAVRPTVVLVAFPAPVYPERFYSRGMTVLIARTRRMPSQAVNPACKSTNNLNNILAKREALAARADEALFLNLHGEVAEGTATNVFFRRGDVLYTPSLACGILPGVTRDTVLGLARRRGWRVQETRALPGELAAAREVFLTGTTLEVAPVRRVVWQGRVRRVGTGRPGPWTLDLQNAYASLRRPPLGDVLS